MRNKKKSANIEKANDFHEYSTKCWSSIKFAKYAFGLVLYYFL